MQIFISRYRVDQRFKIANKLIDDAYAAGSLVYTLNIKNLVQSSLKCCCRIVLSVSPGKFLNMQILGLYVRTTGSEILYYSASVF